MRLTILGMNGPYPAPCGACSGYWVEAGSTSVAVDLGCGTLAALTALTPPEKLDALLLTHWHGDHCSDVLPLIYRLESVMAKGGAGAKTLDVYAPADANAPVRAALQGCKAVCLHDVAAGDTLHIGGLTVRAFAARHPVPAVMYRLTDGAKSLAMTGDTNTTADLPALAEHADLLVADGLFTRALWAEGKPHLSAEKAAALARAAGAKALIVTHLNPEIDPKTLLREACAVYPTARLAACGMQVTL